MRFLRRSSTSRLQTNGVVKQVRIDCGDEPSGDVTTALVTYRGAQCISTTGPHRGEDASAGNGPRLIALGLNWPGRRPAEKKGSFRFWSSSVKRLDSTSTGQPGRSPRPSAMQCLRTLALGATKTRSRPRAGARALVQAIFRAAVVNAHLPLHFTLASTRTEIS